MVIELGLAHSIARRFETVMGWGFHLPGSGAVAFITGILSGYPVGAKTVVMLYEEKLCSRDEAQRMLAFCNNSGPLFIIGTVGAIMLGDINIGIALYVIHIFSAITVGILFRGKNVSHKIRHDVNYKFSSFTESFTKSILESINTIILICGYVVFFAALIAILRSFGAFYAISLILDKFGFPREIVESLLTGIIEISTGCNALTLSRAPLPLISLILAWSGLSAIAQVSSVISKSGLSLKRFAVSKSIHGIIAAIYTAIFIKIRPILPASVAQKNRLQTFTVDWLPLFLYAILFIMTIILFSKKHRNK
jgi:sporulation integral membrane protein YlbJ